MKNNPVVWFEIYVQEMEEKGRSRSDRYSSSMTSLPRSRWNSFVI